MPDMRKRSPAGSNPAHLELTIPLPSLPHPIGSGAPRPVADLRCQSWAFVNAVCFAGAPWTQRGLRNRGIDGNNLLARGRTADVRSGSKATEKQILR